MKLSSIKAATKAIEDGAWVSSPLFPGVKHRVRGIGCAEARRLRDKLIDAIPRVSRVNGLSDADALAVEAEVIARAIWLEVSGLTDDNDDPVVLTPEKALSYLKDPEFALLRDDVRAAASRVGDEQIANGEEAAKN